MNNLIHALPLLAVALAPPPVTAHAPTPPRADVRVTLDRLAAEATAAIAAETRAALQREARAALVAQRPLLPETALAAAAD